MCQGYEGNEADNVLNHQLNSCEADPGMLADYIIALLKHDKPIPELQPLMLSQLEDFLNEGNFRY